MDCPRCEAPVVDGARFCATCGVGLDADVDSTRSMPAVARDGGTGGGTGGGDATDGATDGEDGVDGRDGADTTATARGAPSASLRSCPGCGADNSSSRILCARCGVDLDSGQRPAAAPVVHQPGPADDISGDVSSAGGGRGARTAWVVAAIVVVGAVAGVLLGFRIADRGSAPVVSMPTFDQAVYPGEPEVLPVVAVGASSTRPDAGDVAYAAANLVDDDVTSAWSHDPSVEAAADVDLALELAEPAWVTALTFANGAQSDDLAFPADGRVLALRLLVNGDAVADLELLDQPGLQRVELPEPVLVETIRLVVQDAVAGDTYDEVSISEIVVTGHPAVGEDLRRMVESTAADAGSDADA